MPRVRDVLALLHRVGLDYIHVGQQATMLSGGEAQRVKLAKELSKRATGGTLYFDTSHTTWARVSTTWPSCSMLY